MLRNLPLDPQRGEEPSPRLSRKGAGEGQAEAGESKYVTKNARSGEQFGNQFGVKIGGSFTNPAIFEP